MRHYGGGIGHFKRNTKSLTPSSSGKVAGPDDSEDEQGSTDGDVARDAPTQDVNMRDEEAEPGADENSDADDDDEDSTDPENYDYSKNDADDEDDDEDEGSTCSSDESDEEGSNASS